MAMDAHTIRALTNFNEIVDKMKLDPRSANAEIKPSQDGSGELLLVVKASDPASTDLAKLTEVLDRTPGLNVVKDTFTKQPADTVRGYRAANAIDLAQALAEAKEVAPMARTRAAS